MSRNLHSEPFTQETITKLEIFEAYLREWLPVFIQSPYYSSVNICDYFAGAGKDPEGTPGSPLRILRVLEEYRDSIMEKRFHIRLILNEFAKRKYNEMKASVDAGIQELNMNGSVVAEYFNKDFQELFRERADEIKDQPNLIFLDQNGIKHVSQQIFSTLDSFQRTDFMFFIASSFFNRFGKTSAFKEYFPDLDQSAIKDVPFTDIHRAIVDYYKGKLPQFSKTRLSSFTIKKDQNIYGLIFGTKNILGAEKFLHIAWGKNAINGEANFDIDDDIDKQQAELFPEMKRKTKIEKFHDDLRELINESGSVTNKAMYDYAVENGFLPAHVTDWVRKMRQEGIVEYQGHARISYDKCYKNPELLTFELVK